jgi:hypothetical protein
MHRTRGHTCRLPANTHTNATGPLFTETGHKEQQVMRRAGSFSQWGWMDKKRDVNVRRHERRQGETAVLGACAAHTQAHTAQHSMPHGFGGAGSSLPHTLSATPKGVSCVDDNDAATKPPCQLKDPCHTKKSAENARGSQRSHTPSAHRPRHISQLLL